MQPSLPLFSPLADVGFILAQGRDADTFLHAQLSQRIEGLPPRQAPLAAWHDAQGRVLALFRVLPLPAGRLLATRADMVAPLLDRLRPFVLRAKVSLTNASGESQGAALLGAVSAVPAASGLGSQQDASVQGDGLVWVRVAAELVHVFGAPAHVAELSGQFTNVPAEQAALAEIRLGLPEVGAAIAARFLPQMLNLDLLGGVAADKGCYPGQEVITRTQHRGSVKRRMRRFRAALAIPPAAGSELLDESGGDAGEVVRAARSDESVEILAVVRIDAPRRLFAAGFPATPLERMQLPYESSA